MHSNVYHSTLMQSSVILNALHAIQTNSVNPTCASSVLKPYSIQCDTQMHCMLYKRTRSTPPTQAQYSSHTAYSVIHKCRHTPTQPYMQEHTRASTPPMKETLLGTSTHDHLHKLQGYVDLCCSWSISTVTRVHTHTHSHTRYHSHPHPRTHTLTPKPTPTPTPTYPHTHTHTVTHTHVPTCIMYEGMGGTAAVGALGSSIWSHKLKASLVRCTTPA